tara:strand:- start:2298 stop:2672 length:375 start_codon:yes stop_codon:yes gene_type:complete
LKIIQDAGYQPEIIEYLDEGWTRPQLLGLFAAANLTPRGALRTSKSPAKELGLLDESVSDDTILAAMLEHPVLVNRPIVCSEKGVKLCRPSEAVLDLLEKWPKGPYKKEDGELIINGMGERVKP